MNTKKTLVMAVIAIIAVLAYWIDTRTTEKHDAAKAAALRLIAANKTDLSEVTIKEGGNTKQFVKKGEDWEIAQPIQVRGDGPSLTSLIDAIDNARRMDSFDPKAIGKNYADYGLEKPEITLEVKAAGKNFVQDIELGAKSTSGEEVYARVAKDPQVFLVNQALVNELTKPVKDFRYKWILPASLDEATKAELNYEGKTLAIQKTGADWTLQSPIKGPGDAEKIKDTLGNIQRIAANDFIDTHPLNLATMGLDQPTLTGRFTALVKNKPTSMTLLVGKEVPKQAGQYYAMNPGTNYAFTIAKDDLAKLKPNLDDLRSKKLFTTGLTEASRVIIDMRGQTVDLSADSARKWHYTTNPGVKLDQPQVNGMVSSLVNLHAVKFIDDVTSPGETGLDKPFLRLTVVGAGGRTTETVVTGLDAKSGDFVYAKPLATGQVVGIPSDQPKKFFVTKDQYLDKTLFNFDENQVRQLRLKDSGRTVVLTAQPSGAWSIKGEGANKEFQVEGAKVSALIYAINVLNWSKHFDPNIPVDEAAIRLHKIDQPGREIVLLDKDGKELARMSQAPESDKDQQTFIRRGDKDYFGVDKLAYNTVRTSLDTVIQTASPAFAMAKAEPTPAATPTVTPVAKKDVKPEAPKAPEAKPAAKPEAPKAAEKKAAAPEVKPAAPAAKPATPTAKPATPAVKPEATKAPAVSAPVAKPAAKPAAATSAAAKK